MWLHPLILVIPSCAQGKNANSWDVDVGSEDEQEGIGWFWPSRPGTTIWDMSLQKDGKVKLTFMILMKVNRCSFGSRIWLSLSHCVHLTGSFSYQLKQEVVKGLTLDICHSGKLTPELEKSFTSSISALEVPRFSNTRVHALESNGGRGSLSFTVKLQRNWGSRSFGDLWRHGFHDVVSILGAEKHQVTSDSQLMLEGKAF